MESKCQVNGCKSLATKNFTKDSISQLVCKSHFEELLFQHRSMRLQDLKQVKLSTKVFLYQLIKQDPSCSDLYYLSSFSNSSYLFTISTINLSLPKKFTELIFLMVRVLVEKVLKMPNGQSEKVKNKCMKFVDSLKLIIYNLEINSLTLVSLVEDAYNKFHSEIEEFTSSGLVKLLDRAETFFEMTQTARKKLIFVVNLSDEKQRYIEKFFSRDVIDKNELIHEFYSTFDVFIKKKAEMTREFDEFLSVNNEKKNQVFNKIFKNLTEYIQDYLNTLSFQRIGVFSRRLNDDGNDRLKTDEN